MTIFTMCDDFYIELVANPRVVHDNYFYGGFINFFFFTI